MPDQNKIKVDAALKKNIVAGVKDLDSGRFQVYDDTSRMRLADEVGRSGRARLNATMEAGPTKAYNQDDATGFIRLSGLRLKVAAKVHGKKK
jgi:hypothetical protein